MSVSNKNCISSNFRFLPLDVRDVGNTDEFKAPRNAKYALFVDVNTTVLWSGIGSPPQQIKDELRYGLNLSDIEYVFR